MFCYDSDRSSAGGVLRNEFRAPKSFYSRRRLQPAWRSRGGGLHRARGFRGFFLVLVDTVAGGGLGILLKSAGGGAGAAHEAAEDFLRE